MVIRAVANGRDSVIDEDVIKVLEDFIPPSYPVEIELQNLVAVQALHKGGRERVACSCAGDQDQFYVVDL